LQRIHPWLGKAVHVRWNVRRSLYQSEADALLIALSREHGRIPHALALRLEGFLGRLYKEWFPRDWRRDPTYAEIVHDFRWWLGVAERWSQPPPKTPRASRRKPVRLADQPKRLLRMLRLPLECSKAEFLTAWRRFLKANHPDLNPDQTPDERRRFAEAVGLWKR
jgi:hypothetical protein